jgi:Domain of unknown function (DUF4148)
MKLSTFIVAAALAIPAVSSFAQTASDQPLTRADVKAQLVQAERAGYNPFVRDDTKYPADIQAADAKIAAQNGSSATSYGGMSDTTIAAGAPLHSSFGDNQHSIYGNH